MIYPVVIVKFLDRAKRLLHHMVQACLSCFYTIWYTHVCLVFHTLMSSSQLFPQVVKLWWIHQSFPHLVWSCHQMTQWVFCHHIWHPQAFSRNCYSVDQCNGMGKQNLGKDHFMRGKSLWLFWALVRHHLQSHPTHLCHHCGVLLTEDCTLKH